MAERMWMALILGCWVIEVCASTMAREMASIATSAVSEPWLKVWVRWPISCPFSQATQDDTLTEMLSGRLGEEPWQKRRRVESREFLVASKTLLARHFLSSPRGMAGRIRRRLVAGRGWVHRPWA